MLVDFDPLKLTRRSRDLQPDRAGTTDLLQVAVWLTELSAKVQHTLLSRELSIVHGCTLLTTFTRFVLSEVVICHGDVPENG